MAVTNRAAFSAATAFQMSAQDKTRTGARAISVEFPSHLAATATEYIAMIVMPTDYKLLAAYITPCAAVTGANTNTTHLNVIDKGTAGTGTTELANLDLTSGNDLVEGAKAIMSEALSATGSAGNVIGLQAEKIGTGLLVPAGTLTLVYQGA